MSGPYKYHVGPLLWYSGDEPYWGGPSGIAGLLDWPKASDLTTPGSDRALCFCWCPTNVTLPSEYDLVATGDCREIVFDSAMADIFEATLGYRPQGAMLIDAIADFWTNGADPAGLERPRGLTPHLDGTLQIHMQGHSKVWSQEFRWGVHPYTNKFRDQIRLTFSKMRNGLQEDAAEERRLAARLSGSWASIVGSTNATNRRHLSRLQSWRADGLTVAQAKAVVEARAAKMEQHDRKVLDYWRLKYRLGDNWKELLPPELANSYPGPLPHDTVLSDNFNRTDDTSLGSNWGNYGLGQWRIVTNQARCNATNGTSLAIYLSDLSSDDHFSQVKIVRHDEANNSAGPIARMNTDVDGYTYVIRNTVGSERRINRYDNGTATNLTSDATTWSGSPTLKISIISDALKAYHNGSEVSALATTDTTHSGILRCGMLGRSDTAQAEQTIADDWTAEDETVVSSYNSSKLLLLGIG